MQSKIAHAAERKAFEIALDQALRTVSGPDREKNVMEAAGVGETKVSATVPYAEVADYATRLRSLSRGTGEFELEMTGYEQVPHDVQQKLAQEYQERRAAGQK